MISISAYRQAFLLSLLNTLSQSDVDFLAKHSKTRSKNAIVATVVDLPREILGLMFSYLIEPQSFARCSQSCRRWQRVLEDNHVWKLLCRQKSYKPLIRKTLPMLEATAKEIRRSSSYTKLLKAMNLAPWKNVYRNNYMTYKNWMVGHCSVVPLKQNHSGFLAMDFDDSRALSIRHGQPGKFVC